VSAAHDLRCGCDECLGPGTPAAGTRVYVVVPQQQAEEDDEPTPTQEYATQKTLHNFVQQTKVRRSAEVALWEAQAKAAGISRTEWMRRACNAYAGKASE
jgi:hypothetical protein